MKKWMVLLVAMSMSCPVLSLAADGAPKGVEAAGTTVKGSKSNSDNRGSGGSVDAATTVKSSKSNSSERAGSGAADAAAKVKSGKSNSSD